MTTHLKDFGNRVKIARNNLGISQEELANRIGYKTKGSIARIEKGERDLPIDKLKLMANSLNTTPEYLMGWDTPTTPSIDHCSIDDVSDEEFYLVEHKGEMIKFYIKKLSPEERIELTNNKKGALAFNDKVSEEDMNLLENVLSEMYLKNKLGK